MIHPNLATMLAVVTTDYALEPGEAIEFLRPAVEESFNSISVDGECSTNDTVVLLANGASAAPRDDDAFRTALHAVCRDLAAQIVADGEGATVVAEINVRGAASAGRGEGDRTSHRDLAARQDRAVRARRELGPHPRGRGLGAVQRRLRAPRSRRA